MLSATTRPSCPPSTYMSPVNYVQLSHLVSKIEQKSDSSLLVSALHDIYHPRQNQKEKEN